MTELLLEKYPGYPLLSAGGVMSNRYIRQVIESRVWRRFSVRPLFASDNAAGIAVLAARMAQEVENAEQYGVECFTA